MILLVLALIWAAALLPPLIRSRMEGNPVDSVGRFRRHLRVLESATPAASSLASDPLRTAGGMPLAWAIEARRLHRLRRRQQVVRSLLALMATTLILGLLPSLRFVLVLHVLADVAFVSYITMLARARSAELRRRPVAGSPATEERSETAPPGLSQAY